ncbi:MAG: nickel transporter [Leptolyngbya foveolarum]|uniref:Nickel transporter n=1 Tax=Leptolyngbya foveolarum TaxID=47253 RepID=A0A2W4WHL0_9CYAN|nr:MAG: nickel transporter [Leptolyngbya foveolarum]
MEKSLSAMFDALPALLAGALITIQLTAAAVAFGSVGGIFLGVARLSKIAPIRWLAKAYIEFFRGTPLLVQLFIIYFGIPSLLRSTGLAGFSFGQWGAAVLGLSLNSAAYLAEIVRGGIQSVENGQREASESLGLDSNQTLFYVIFPQALRRMIPPLGNEFVVLLKDTSLVAFIGYQELLRQGQLIIARNFLPFQIYFVVALIYLAMTLLASQVFSWLERKMDPAK